MSLSAALRRLDTDLRHAQGGWALVGGLAVSVRTEPRFTRDVDVIVVDLLFASSGIEPELVASAELRQIDTGLVVPVARTGHLIAMKLLARDDETRPLDAADLLALREVADDSERHLAREAVELITARGYHRGRDLRGALVALLEP